MLITNYYRLEICKSGPTVEVLWFFLKPCCDLPVMSMQYLGDLKLSLKCWTAKIYHKKGWCWWQILNEASLPHVNIIGLFNHFLREKWIKTVSHFLVFKQFFISLLHLMFHKNLCLTFLLSDVLKFSVGFFRISSK